MILQRGMIGPDIAKLVNDLIRVGFAPDSGPGNNFNANVETAVRAFQSAHIGPDRAPLVIDGKVGPLTRFALDIALGDLPSPEIPNQPLPNIPDRPADSSLGGWNGLQIAKQELARGAGETLGDNLGPDINRYRAVTHAGAGESWCASFISYCFDRGNPDHMPFTPEAGARALLKQFQDKGWDYQASVDSPPAPGDIIVWWRESLASWKGHIGIIASYEHGIVKTIEGNRGPFPSKVASFQYTLGQIQQLLGFGRAVP